MHSTTPFFAQHSLLEQDSESLLKAHALSAQSFHADCRQAYRWSGRAKGLVEWIDSLLAHRFATTLVLVGVPALAIATLV
jgi:hypothetical protein